ncbi:pre-mRNA 3'-end-processing factor FIP1-like isoform X1 [Histomonas meleagridis]|uniref:pre-mRNA 3'-end-processing factor FIP1-like isoform X1 n=1 Tax=Histomonas meleagridis TaxID=135588 RepID=UPI003559A32B|nr:pre-mRNA 3'-end-processing factor FIP1-like isoform X1 [Histomonas meleagridis]KAH0797726.1 pre-mRNA 3'-end-processing factor FIP1-like isoform X1 [Histomonas meleagridis]
MGKNYPSYPVHMLEDFSDSDYTDDTENEEEVAIIMNVHMPIQEEQRQRYDPFFSLAAHHQQFKPTNFIALPNLKFVPTIEEEKEGDEPKPWRETPKLMPDYFNYGFTELVWEAYKYKQHALRQMYSDKKTNNLHRRNQRK